MTKKMPLFERTVDTIVTDNKAVIETLNNRIVELERELSSLVRGIKDLGSISYDQFPDTKTAENILKEPNP